MGNRMVLASSPNRINSTKEIGRRKNVLAMVFRNISLRSEVSRENGIRTNPMDVIYIWGTDLPVSQQERYEGEFLNGRRHGVGNYAWPTGDRYEGHWKEGRQDGLGTYFWKTGSKYEGMWKENKKHGFGSFLWPNGDKFEGEWEEGIPVEVEKSMHDDVKRAIAEQQCTKVVEGLRTKRGQVYSSCTKCGIRVCVVCASTCHSNSHLHSCPPSSLFWSSLNNCGCSSCLSS